MEDDISKIDQHIIKLKQRKEKLQTQKACLLAKEAKVILGDKFSIDLVLHVLFHSWNTSTDKQKEEWINSAHSFRETKSQEAQSQETQSREINSRKYTKQNPQETQKLRADDSQNSTENLQS